MAKPIPYPKQYVCSVVKCECENLTDVIEGRYRLRVRLRNSSKKTLTIAMMNPSKADEQWSDNTVNKVIRFVFHENANQQSLVRDIGYIDIVNIFPMYEPNSNNVKELIEAIILNDKLTAMQERNRQAFDDALSESKIVVLAWGDVPSKVKASLHNQQASNMFSSIKSHGLEGSTYVFKYEEYDTVLTKKKRPRHPSRNTPAAYTKVKNMSVSRNFLYLSVGTTT